MKPGGPAVANVNLSPAKARLPDDRAPPRGRLDFSTTLFTRLTAGVFLILAGAVGTAGILFSQGL